MAANGNLTAVLCIDARLSGDVTQEIKNLYPRNYMKFLFEFLL